MLFGLGAVSNTDFHPGLGCPFIADNPGKNRPMKEGEVKNRTEMYAVGDALRW